MISYGCYLHIPVWGVGPLVGLSRRDGRIIRLYVTERPTGGSNLFRAGGAIS